MISGQSLLHADFIHAVLLLVGILSGPLWSQSQPGDPVIYNQTQTTSHAYIDASMFIGTSTDFCTVLNQALLALAGRPSGIMGVIDARGVNPSAMTCNSNPWTGFSAGHVPVSVILLPAGTIKMNATWILPSGTRLIGEGGEDPGSSALGTTRTILQAQAFSTPIIQMGTSSPCRGVSIEDLVLDGNGLLIDGIDNQYCQELSYVNHVSIYRAGAKGLNIFGSATNSGPYTNITFDLGTATPSSATVCAYLTVSTRGIRGMTCTTDTYNAISTDAIQLLPTAAGNSIEDVRIEGFQNGIYVNASDIVLMNILGDSKTTNASQIVSVVNLAALSVSNVTMIGITNNCSTTNSCGTLANNDSITDNTTSPAIHLSVTSDSFVGMYSVGSAIVPGSVSPVSRFTTSTSMPSWLVGAGVPTGPCNTSTSPAAGSLYSNSSSGAGLYVCSAATSQWTLVK
jgi:hypothetical protein